MNVKQRRTVMGGVGVLLLMLLFPPWLYFDGATSNQTSAGYHAFFSPPPVKTYHEMFGIPDDEVLVGFVRTQLNGIRLAFQLSLVVSLTLGLTLRFGQKSSCSYGCCFAVAFCAVAILILLALSKF